MKVAVQIDLCKHGALWEDFYDGAVSERRRREKGGTIRPVKRGVAGVPRASRKG